MPVRFARSYIDRLFADRDTSGLYHLITVIEKERILPEQLWLFCQLKEWEGSARSGVWQYYEALSVNKFERVDEALRLFELVQIAEKYRFGKRVWEEPSQAASLDKWIDEHGRKIDGAVFGLALSQKEWLCTQS